MAQAKNASAAKMMQIPKIPMPKGPMSTYQVIGTIKNQGRFSAAQLNHILTSLQEVSADEQQQCRSSGCRLLNYSWTADATTCYMQVQTDSHLFLSAFLAKMFDSTFLDCDITVHPISTREDFFRLAYQLQSASGGGGAAAGRKSVVSQSGQS